MRNTQPGALPLDELDFAIVRTLSEDPAQSNKAVAAVVGAAESTCAYRIRRLRDAAVIKQGRLELDEAKLGYPLRAVVMVFLANHSRKVVDRVMAGLVSTPNVLQVMNLTGRYDFMVTVAVADGDALRNFVLDHVTVDPAVRGTETYIVFDRRDGEWIPAVPA